MATADLAIAKAALSAALFRADPKSLTRGAVDDFTGLLNDTLDECSRPNVKRCKDWIAANVIHSSSRTAALGKFLAALLESMETDFDRPSVRRRRLHALYIASDVLHHVVVRLANGSPFNAWDAHLPALVASAASFEKCPKHLKKVEDLIALWELRAYLAPALIARLRESLTRASDSTSGTRIQMSSEALKLAKEAPYIMPSLHGDPSAPWHHLPPASWLLALGPNMTGPLRRSLLRPAQLSPGPASRLLADAVKALLARAEELFESDKKPVSETTIDLNPLGEKTRPPSGSSPDGDTYYGWSPTFCRRIRLRNQRAPKTSHLQSPHPARQWTSSLGPSRTPSPQSPRSPKRRRFSSARSPSRRRSSSRSPSRSRNRDRSRGRSRSRSRSRSPARSLNSSRSRSQSRSPGRSLNRGGRDLGRRQHRHDSPESSLRSPPGASRGLAPRRGRPFRRRSRTNSPSRSRSRSRPRHRSPTPDVDQFPTSVSQHPPPVGYTVPPPPPPPPIGYQGTFPPPPPPPPFPPPPHGWIPNNQPGFAAPPMPGVGWGIGMVPPPPPPPPPQQQQQQQQQPAYDASFQQASHHHGWESSGRAGTSRGPYWGRSRGGNGRGASYGYGAR